MPRAVPRYRPTVPTTIMPPGRNVGLTATRPLRVRWCKGGSPAGNNADRGAPKITSDAKCSRPTMRESPTWGPRGHRRGCPPSSCNAVARRRPWRRSQTSVRRGNECAEPFGLVRWTVALSPHVNAALTILRNRSGRPLRTAASPVRPPTPRCRRPGQARPAQGRRQAHRPH